MKIFKKLMMCLIMIALILAVAEAATYPAIMNNISGSLDKIKEWLVKIATPAAAIGVITGVLIKKFSFGDQERMIVGRRLVRASLTSYILVVGLDLILKAISTFVAKK